MMFKDGSDSFVGYTGNITVECDFRTMRVVILRSGEIEYYCELKFQDSWGISNIILVNDIGSQKELFIVDLEGNDYTHWVNQIKKAFDDFVTENIKVDFYKIDGIKIEVI